MISRFRWVSIQLEYLCTLKTKHDIENRLGQLPPKLSDMYGELFRRKTELYGPEQRRILDVALSSLLLPIRPGAMVFAQMLFANEWDESSDEDHGSCGDGSSDEDHGSCGDGSSDEDDSSGGNESSDEDDSSDWNECSDEDESSSGSDANRSASGPVKKARIVQGHEAVTELCFNLVVFDSTSSVFRFAHTSVQDYLLMHGNGYYASHDLNSSRVAQHFISLLLHVPDQIHKKDQTFLQAESQEEETDIKFWYVQPSPANSQTRLERTLAWVQDKWGFFVSSSGEYRENLPLSDLEVRLQQKVVLQPLELVNPRIFFSACRYGLGSFVDTWTKTHAYLINVRLLPAVDKQHKKLLGTGLQHACIGGDSRIVERLIDEGAVLDYYSQGTPKTNALCIALQHRNTTITKLLLDKGASPSLALDADVRFPLHSTIFDGHEDALSLVQILLEHGADADSVDDRGMTAIALAVWKENLEIVHLLLREHAKRPLRLSIDDGRTNILVLATIIRTTPVKSLKMVQLMLEHGVDVDFRTARAETPLWCAAENGNLDVARLLLDHGAAVDVQDVRGKTPLIAALRKLRSVSGTRVQISKPPRKPLGSIAQMRKHEDVARLLITSGANTNLCTVFGWTALHYAAENGSLRIVELLIGHGTNPNVTNKYRSTALHLAAKNGAPKVVELLLRHSANPNLTNKNGWTALHVAVNNHSPEIVDLLLRHGANPDVTINNGRTAMHLAARHGHKEIVQSLLAYDAILDARDEEGWNALHNAAKNGHEPTAQLLLAYNADAKAPNLYGWTALHLAANGGHVNMVALLVNAGSDLSAVEILGYTALSIAAVHGQDKVVEALLNLGADPNIVHLHGNNALSTAAGFCKPEVCELLLPNTADINSQDGDGDTALSNAVHVSQPPYIIELLLEAGAQIAPQQPGPHCSFLDHTERIEGYGNDALLKAWHKKNMDLLQTILSFAARRDPSSEYAIALVLWGKKDKTEFEAWMEARRANAPENRPEIVAFRKEIKRREDEIIKQNKQRLALELGLDPLVKDKA